MKIAEARDIQVSAIGVTVLLCAALLLGDTFLSVCLIYVAGRCWYRYYCWHPPVASNR